MTTLLNIAGVDYTKNVKIDSYVVNAAKVYAEWTDANEVTHRHPKRERVAGTFELAFANREEYSQFIDHMTASESVGGYIPTYLFVSNRNEYRSCNLFYDFDVNITKDASAEKRIIPFKIKVTER